MMTTTAVTHKMKSEDGKIAAMKTKKAEKQVRVLQTQIID